MSELSDAMREAVASVANRHPAPTSPRRDTGVRVLDLDALPPVRHRRLQAASVAQLLEEQAGRSVRAGWQVFAEAVRTIVLFWGSAVGVASIDAISSDGLGASTMLWATLGTAAALRALLAIRPRSR